MSCKKYLGFLKLGFAFFSLILISKKSIKYSYDSLCRFFEKLLKILLKLIFMIFIIKMS
ncbi:hypothetical protein GSM39_03350 [Campylobacter coli]|nr:hypothetical protein [Campylobacter coli]EDO7456059.1 hypothetical protein [Campylobacter coli]EDO9014082.1 hypothetical protein [Campylobacter coli]EDO9305406.1 hypothetical protein [Campylobacter coli]EEA8295493.1 hypothetical protein [Campylobacter coli]